MVYTWNILCTFLCTKCAMYISYPLYEAPYRYHINPNPIGHIVYAAPFVQNGATYIGYTIYAATVGSQICRIYHISYIRGACSVKQVPRILDTHYTRHHFDPTGSTYMPFSPRYNKTYISSTDTHMVLNISDA